MEKRIMQIEKDEKELNLKIEKLAKEFREHCNDNKKNLGEIKEQVGGLNELMASLSNTVIKKLDNISQFNELVPTLRKVAEADKAKTWLSIQVANALRIIGIIVGIMAGLFGVAWAIYKEWRK
jgi:t-SNARE complex subunit (syntaxin)